MRKFIVVFSLLCTGCASSLEKEFEQIYSRIKANSGRAYCYDVFKPESIKGKYCTMNVDQIYKQSYKNPLGPL